MAHLCSKFDGHRCIVCGSGYTDQHEEESKMPDLDLDALEEKYGNPDRAPGISRPWTVDMLILIARVRELEGVLEMWQDWYDDKENRYPMPIDQTREALAPTVSEEKSDG